MKGLLFSIVGQVVIALASLAGVRIYTELMTREEFGIAMMAVGGLALLDGIIVMALNQTLLSICGRIEDPERQRQVAIGLAFRLLCVLLLVLLPTAVVTLVMRFDTLVSIGPFLVLLYFMAELAKTSALGPLIARREYGRFSLWSGSEALVSLAGTSAALLVQADALSFLFGLIAARCLNTTAFLLLFFRGRYFSGVDLAAATPYLATAIRYGAPLSAMAPIGWVGSYFDRYVIGAAGGLASAGIYTAVAGLVGRPYAVTTAILTNYYRPLLFRPSNSVEPSADLWTIQTRWILAAALIGLSGAAAVALLAKPIVTITLAREFRAGAPLLMFILAIAQSLSIMTHAVDNAVLATGASARLLRLQVWTVLISLLLVPGFTLWLGAVGAALGRLLSEAIKFVLSLALSWRLLGGSGVPQLGAKLP